jgi:aspartate-semialdehyde dehydrogenase
VEGTSTVPGFASGTQDAPELNPKLFGSAYPPQEFLHPIFGNLLPHIGSFEDNGYTDEEMKLVNETRKIMHAPDIAVSATTVRVPVAYAHSLDVHVEFSQEITPDQARATLSSAAGVVLQDDPAKNQYPMPLPAGGTDATFVGRIREDLAFHPGLAMWIVADNIRKGAALNAIQIAEVLVEKGMVS